MSQSSSQTPPEVSEGIHLIPSRIWRFWCLFVIFVPFLGVLVYLIARGGSMSKRAMAQQQRDAATADEYVRSVAATSGGGSSADQIASAKQLLDAGTITQAEFDQLKAKALA